MSSSASVRLALLASLLMALGACEKKEKPPTPVTGDPKDAQTAVLEAGARVLQSSAPPAGMDIHLVGFHPLRQAPEHQMAAHHFCRQVNEDFAQCVLFDGDSKEARLNGIEYIISEKLFASLPESERQYWHPHNYEILSGQLVAPGIPGAAEKALMRKKMNSYGKTWHVWNTGGPDMSGDSLPLGEARLAWSFNRDGELRQSLQTETGRRLGIDPEAKRAERADLTVLSRPQAGVDALKGKFDRPTRDLPGVESMRGGG